MAFAVHNVVKYIIKGKQRSKLVILFYVLVVV